MMMRLLGIGAVLATCAMACAAAPEHPAEGLADTVPATTGAPAAGGSAATPATSASSTSTSAPSAAMATKAPVVDTLGASRARLLDSYVAFLESNAQTPQSNGLSAANATSSCTAWSGLAPSAQLVFLTLTARLQASKLGTDGSSMLSHVTKIYRIAGGEDATANDPGSCGGGEFNRMIMSMDSTLHDALVAANTHQGEPQNGKLDISDAINSSFWRDSHDLGGPHAPFDSSDETDHGAPRGQTQYFADPNTALAKAPLGRQDLETLVDPLALEMDQDYDCTHNSNPACSYSFYGALCFPQAQKTGVDIYTGNYGAAETEWKPSCQ